MKAVARFAVFLILLASAGSLPAQEGPSQDSSLTPQASRDVPDIAVREIQRRGDLVQRVGGGHQSDTLTAFAEAMRPPAARSMASQYSTRS